MTSLVRAEALSRSFRARQGLFARQRNVFAVQAVDLHVAPAEIVGVVGESGCGKSTLGRLLLRLMPPTEGRVTFEGQDLATLGATKLRDTRRRMQMVFQDPFGSLDPRRPVGAQVADGLDITGPDAIAALLTQVGLDPHQAARLPHEFSGGQRQRIAIARALASRPAFIVADEPVAALDVSIQAQIVNLLADLRQRLGLALLFISHDLHVVRHLADRVVVMYLGRVIEEGPAAAVFHAPAHPYTRALLAASPSLRRNGLRRNGLRNTGATGTSRRTSLSGELPSPLDPPSGCAFRTRCPFATPACAESRPPLAPIGADRQVACIRVNEIG